MPSRRITSRGLFPFLFACVALGSAGCGGNVSLSNGDGGSGGETGGAGGGNGGSQGGAGGSVGGTAGTGGIGGGPACDTAPAGSFTMSIQTPQGQVWSCDAWDTTQQGDLTFDAAVVKSSLNVVSLDACSPAADCVPLIYEVTFGADGLGVDIPVGALVHVEASVNVPWGCAQRLLITNLPSWDGMPNPVQTNHQLWVAATDGMADMFADAPFVVDRLKLDCPGYPAGGCGGEVEPGQYMFRFTPTNNAGPAVIIETGEVKSLSLVDTPVTAAKNLRSFEPGICDDYWNWGYWVMPSGIK